MKKLFKTLAPLALVIGMMQAATAAEPIRVGAILSLTGPAGYLGEPQLKTMTMYVNQINAAGGVLGRPLELIHYDDASEASKANSFTKRLIDADKVDILVGGSTTGTSMAAYPLVERAQIPFISFGGGVPVVEPVKKWMFKTPHTDRMAAEKVFEDMKKRGITKVALLSETSGFGQSGRTESKKVAARYGITLVADETYGAKDADMTPQLAKIKAIPDAQAVFIFGFGQGPAIATKNYAQIGLKLPLYQSHGVAANEYLKLAGPAAEGVRLPSPALLVADALPASDPLKVVSMSYVTDYKARYGDEPNTFGGYARDGLLLAVDAIKRAGTTDHAKVRDAIEQTRGFVGTTGVFNMSPTDHMGLDLSAFRMLEVKNGNWSLIN